MSWLSLIVLALTIPVTTLIAEPWAVPHERGIATHDFLATDEFQIDAYQQTLKGKTGAYLAAGTFRLFNYSRHGNFSTVVGVDYNRLAKELNQRISEALAEKRTDRFRAMATVYGKDLANPVLKKARAGEISENAFYQWVVSEEDNLPPRDSGDISKTLRSETPFFLKTFRGQWKKTIFGSDEAFSSGQRLARAGEYHFFTGDWTGSRTIPRLAKTLRKKNTQVSVIDLSNLIDYFREKGGHELIANLKEFDLAPDAVVLFTVNTGILTLTGGGLFSGNLRDALAAQRKEPWLYFSMPAKQFLEAFAKDHVRLDFYRTLNDLIRAGDAQGLRLEYPRIPLEQWPNQAEVADLERHPENLESYLKRARHSDRMEKLIGAASRAQPIKKEVQLQLLRVLSDDQLRDVHPAACAALIKARPVDEAILRQITRLAIGSGIGTRILTELKLGSNEAVRKELKKALRERKEGVADLIANLDVTDPEIVTAAASLYQDDVPGVLRMFSKISRLPPTALPYLEKLFEESIKEDRTYWWDELFDGIENTGADSPRLRRGLRAIADQRGSSDSRRAKQILKKLEKMKICQAGKMTRAKRNRAESRP